MPYLSHLYAGSLCCHHGISFQLKIRFVPLVPPDFVIQYCLPFHSTPSLTAAPAKPKALPIGSVRESILPEYSHMLFSEHDKGVAFLEPKSKADASLWQLSSKEVGQRQRRAWYARVCILVVLSAIVGALGCL